MQIVTGRKFFPSLVDRVLVRDGYAGQMDEQPLPEWRRDNLCEPVPSDYGMRGRFEPEARSRSLH
ncbi:hypothetical protein [Dyella acidiphila]|uniref:hypothetical protein n=1 Tax=Dyella acidiphila TaxID=2775866 RepID=UPI0017879CA9|nr:hypothetical protein [Dyella acidiphila]